ncbi:hypothetical protein N658DRAFT_202873 [Parathielavia hyrcaniae]|uniref:Uncharacterized protein n=1 Tax=Parathielavia hyrcaniae TaxID=113614 RepID=A0AAN6PWC0_9PEZI|nr:hypothetical protein N658DRAFT_202873 [Parathielavia hyrcaniae]
MSDVITVANKTKHDLQVSVTSTGGDFAHGGGEGWYSVPAHGNKTFDNRNEHQIVRYAIKDSPGAEIVSLLGVPGQTTTIS